MPSGRRAPPPPPSNSGGEKPPPLPNRGGAGKRTNFPASVPPPLPNRPSPVGEPADAMYEDMNGGSPQIIDARPNQGRVHPVPSHSTSSNPKNVLAMKSPSPQPPPQRNKPKTGIRTWESLGKSDCKQPTRFNNNACQGSTVGEWRPPIEQQQPDLDQIYELPVENAQRDCFTTDQEQRMDSGLSIEADESHSGNDTYEAPDGQPADSGQDAVYEQPDNDSFSPPSTKNTSPAVNAMGLLKIDNMKSPQIPGNYPSLKPSASSIDKPKPSPKPKANQAMSGLSIPKEKLNQAMSKSPILQNLALSLKARSNSSVGMSAPQSNDSPPEGSSSANSSSSQLAVKFPPSLKTDNPNRQKKISTPPMKPERQATVEEDDPNQIYEEGVSESLYDHDWYHGLLNRSDANSRVLSVAENGAFLIRDSTKAKTEHAYTLVVMNNSKVHNLVIRQRSDRKFVLGQLAKPDELSFNNLIELVDHHRVNNVKLVTQGELVMLNCSPKRI